MTNKYSASVEPARVAKNYKIPCYEKLNIETLYSLLKFRNPRFDDVGLKARLLPELEERRTLTSALQKKDEQLFPYHGHSVSQLKRIVKQHRVPISMSKLKSKQDYVDALTQFPLLRLPPELRTKIYEYALADRVTGPISEIRERNSQPPLLRVSRLLRQESLPVFYRSNMFEVHVSARFTTRRLYMDPVSISWLASIGMAEASDIRRLRVVTGLTEGGHVQSFCINLHYDQSSAIRGNGLKCCCGWCQLISNEPGHVTAIIMQPERLPLLKHVLKLMTRKAEKGKISGPIIKDFAMFFTSAAWGV